MYQENGMYAVVFSYSYDLDTAVYLFRTESEAKAFVIDAFTEQLRIDKEENGRSSEGTIDACKGAAEIVYRFDEEEYKTYIRVGQVYT